MSAALHTSRLYRSSNWSLTIRYDLSPFTARIIWPRLGPNAELKELVRQRAARLCPSLEHQCASNGSADDGRIASRRMTVLYWIASLRLFSTGLSAPRCSGWCRSNRGFGRHQCQVRLGTGSLWYGYECDAHVVVPTCAKRAAGTRRSAEFDTVVSDGWPPHRPRG